MENKALNKYSIYEFDFDYILKTLNYPNNKSTFTISELKEILTYLTGREKISKVELMQTFTQLNLNSDNVILTKQEVKQVYNYYYMLIKEEDVLKDFYKYLTGNSLFNKEINSKINLESFFAQTKELFPNLSYDLLTQVFVFLSDNNSFITKQSIDKALLQGNGI